MTYSMSSLKLKCQRVMEIIIRNETSHDKQKLRQHNLSQIQFSSQIQINLDHQSKAFRFFYHDPITGHHWMNNLINQLSNQDGINPIQFMNLLSGSSNAHNELMFRKQQMEVQFDCKYREYEFFNGIPSQSMLISSLEQICKQTILFMVRSFRGQIIYLSIHPLSDDKVNILRKFCQKFPSRTLHVLIDSIDYGLEHNTQISEEGLKIISKSTDLIYLRRQTDNNLLQDRDRYVRYNIFYNSLLEKYTECKQFEYLQSTILPLVQGLLQYFFSLVRQEMPLLLNSYFDQLSLIKTVIQLNYNRGLQKQSSQFNELQQFSDFIQYQIYILDQMKQNLFKGASLHFPKKISVPQHCCYCKVHKKIKKSTYYTCSACQKQSRIIFPLCPECMQPFHEIKDKLKQGQMINFAPQKEGKIHSLEYKMSSEAQQKNKNKQKFQELLNKNQNEKQKDKLPKRRLGGRIGKTKKIIRKNKKPRLTSQQLQNIKQLQQSSQRLLKLFKNLKNPKLFYKQINKNPKNLIQFKMELKNEFDFMKAVDIQLKREIQTFEGETLIAIHNVDQQKQKVQHHENFSKLLKFEHEQQSHQNIYMTKIQQNSQEYDQSSQEDKRVLIANQTVINKM